MSTPTLTRFDDDFDDWESELQDPPTGTPPTLPPPPPPSRFRYDRAAEHRVAAEEIAEAFGRVRHRSHEREV